MGPVRASRGVSQVLGSGIRFGADLLRGRARLGVAPTAFVRALFRATRPHFFVFPALACWAGASASARSADRTGVILVALALGVAWAVGQLLNDLFDVEADAVDAPDRPAVRGLLPEGPTAFAASLLGLAVAVALSLSHPSGWAMALASALLMLAYAPAKALPLLGNLAHGALMALLALVGALVARPAVPLAEVVGATWPTLAVVGALAALYLQGNYEKDRDGDAKAGYRTLAHVLGVRGSALGRVLVATPLYLAFSGRVAEGAARWAWSASACMLALSALASLRDGARQGALAGYRFTIHSTVLGLGALALPFLGLSAALALFALATLLFELAFARSANP